MISSNSFITEIVYILNCTSFMGLDDSILPIFKDAVTDWFKLWIVISTNKLSFVKFRYMSL